MARFLLPSVEREGAGWEGGWRPGKGGGAGPGGRGGGTQKPINHGVSVCDSLLGVVVDDEFVSHRALSGPSTQVHPLERSQVLCRTRRMGARRPSARQVSQE